MSFKSTSIANLSNSDDELYKAKLVRRRTEAEVLLWQQEEKKCLEYQAQKEAKIVERKWLEEEAQRKQKEEETRRKEEKYQRDLAHCLEADYVERVQKGIAYWDKQNNDVPAPNCILKVQGEIIKIWRFINN